MAEAATVSIGSNGNTFGAEARRAISDAVSEMKREQIADRAVFKENLRIHLKRFVQKEPGQTGYCDDCC